MISSPIRIWDSAQLKNVAERPLRPFLSAAQSRIRIEGPDVPLSAARSQLFAMALHELATNAAKGEIRGAFQCDRLGQPQLVAHFRRRAPRRSRSLAGKRRAARAAAGAQGGSALTSLSVRSPPKARTRSCASSRLASCASSR